MCNFAFSGLRRQTGIVDDQPGLALLACEIYDLDS